MKIKTLDLIDNALNWAVCMANGMKPEGIYISNLGGKHISLYTRLRDDDGNLTGSYMTGPDLMFSRKWESAGPIIEREKIAISFNPEWEVPNWGAWRTDIDDRQEIMGETPLVAAMRCFVASKLGETVDVPDELCGNQPQETLVNQQRPRG